MVLPEKRKTAFLFPGIGVKPFGKEQLFYQKYSEVLAPYLQSGSEAAGVNLGLALVEERVFGLDQLAREVFAFCFSHGLFEVLSQTGLKADLVAGHSLGVYGGLSATGVLSFEECLKIIVEANQLGREFCGQGRFGVGVVIGIPFTEVHDWLQTAHLSSVCLANHNSATSGVYAGIRDEIDQLIGWAEVSGALKVLRLRIDIPFHSPFMAPATEKIRPILKTLLWKRPAVPIISALDHRVLTEPGDLLEMVAKNLSSTIHWPGVIEELVGHGVERVIECGAGVSLTQHGRFIESSPRHYNLKNLRRRLSY